MNFPVYVSTSDGEKTIRCVNWLDLDSNGCLPTTIRYELNRGYLNVNDGVVWIYSGKEKPANPDQYPYFWGKPGEKPTFSEPTEESKEAFREENLRDVSTKIINETLEENEVLYNEQEINDLNDAQAVYVPIIREKDDFLKKIIKQAIINKGIDLARLKYKTSEKYILPNMKAALDNDTKMSVVYFGHWCELLGLDFSAVVYDNGTDTDDPLKKPIMYSSETGKITEEDV